MQEFEFYSNRICNDNKPLYMYRDITELENILQNVYNSVSNCCENMMLFSKKYTECYNISMEEYLKLKIHPRTSIRKSPQLHSERTIFSHIAYLNNVRRYFIDNEVTFDFDLRKKYNDLFLKYIGDYLDLYYKKIANISNKRINVADRLNNILIDIIKAVDNGIDDEKIIFKSISL